MLVFLRYKASDRKLRLFACACCRCVWHLLADERSRRAVEVAEHYADGLAQRAEMTFAHQAASQAAGELYDGNHTSAAAGAAAVVAYLGWKTYAVASQVIDDTCLHLRKVDNYAPGMREVRKAVRLRLRPAKLQQADLLRDMFGPLPFRPIEVDCSWLDWNDHTIPRLAQAIYNDRAFDRLPILADALEEAGCTNADILNHCRQPGEHVRGCWLVDLLLGKS